MTRFYSLALIVFIHSISFAQKKPTEEQGVELFEKKIRPVLIKECYRCHSVEAKRLRGSLRLDSRQLMLRGGESGKPAIVPGKPEQSILLRAMRHQNVKMPPSRKLSRRVIDDFEQWIKLGAPWPENDKVILGKFDLEDRKRRLPWIWQKPTLSLLPKVSDRNWPLDEIDFFILSKLESNNLKPAPDADRRTWLRRVTFAITGLPPTPSEIQSFLADASPNAHGRVVDRLLASPRFGEKWARHWMDLVRYAESRGHESDFILPNAWHYRDYLIRAFNSDVPYDQFVKEHLAGDLLEKPRPHGDRGNESILATAWPFFGEEVHSPVDIRQDECDRIDNKIDVLSKTFLGLTVACARCHDHKFDAITQEDYYALSGFIMSSSYRQVRFETMEHNRKIAEKLDALHASTQTKIAKALTRMTRGKLAKVAENLLANKGVWKKEIELARNDPNHPFYYFALAREKGIEHAKKVRLSQHKESKRSRFSSKELVILDCSDPISLRKWSNGPGFGIRALLPGDLMLPNLRAATYGSIQREPIWSVLQTDPENELDMGRMRASERAGQMIRTRTVRLRYGMIRYLIRGQAKVYVSVDSHLMNIGPLHGQLVRTIKADSLSWVTHDLSRYAGHRAHIEIGPVGDHPFEIVAIVDSKEEPAFRLERDSRSSPTMTGFTSLKRLAGATQWGLRAAIWSVPFIKYKWRSSDDGLNVTWILQRLPLLVADKADLKTIPAILAKYKKDYANLVRQIAKRSHTAVAMMEGNEVQARLLERGSPKRPKDEVPLFLLRAMPNAKRLHSRRQLAEQIASCDNPLTARVMVNRIWHHLFGRGIVATVDNFGFLGERPTHPKLLDHLAVQFQKDWSIKKMIRRMVLSRTFRMSSRPEVRAERIDPKNRLLHRMSVRRLEAESIRDSILAVSGRLNDTMHGKPIPVHLTEHIVGRGRPSISGPLDGAGRRSIYISVRRNFLPTMMLTFDMPTPFSTIGRRNVTNVPGQSLLLMNDPFVHQQASLWAERELKEKRSIRDRIHNLYARAFSRPPSEKELVLCRQTLAILAKARGVGVDDVRVWTDLCHTLFRLNEFIFVR